MALKLDNALLDELGLGSLPEAEKQLLLRQIYEKLEMNVGMRLADQMSNEQLDAFEKFVDANDDKGAFQWLETNFPNYKMVVNEEFEKLKAEIRAVAPQILASAAQNAAAISAGQPQAPAQPQPQPSRFDPQPPVTAQPYQAGQSQQFAAPPQQPTQQQPQSPQPPQQQPQSPQPPQQQLSGQSQQYGQPGSPYGPGPYNPASNPAGNPANSPNPASPYGQASSPTSNYQQTPGAAPQNGHLQPQYGMPIGQPQYGYGPAPQQPPQYQPQQPPVGPNQ